jgi:hypothetical protein
VFIAAAIFLLQPYQTGFDCPVEFVEKIVVLWSTGEATGRKNSAETICRETASATTAMSPIVKD